MSSPNRLFASLASSRTSSAGIGTRSDADPEVTEVGVALSVEQHVGGARPCRGRRAVGVRTRAPTRSVRRRAMHDPARAARPGPRGRRGFLPSGSARRRTRGRAPASSRRPGRCGDARAPRPPGPRRSNRRTNAGSDAICSWTILTATSRPTRGWIARKTTPVGPSPIFSKQPVSAQRLAAELQAWILLQDLLVEPCELR